MNVLILGSGGREHALSWKIAQSPDLTHLYIAPGNAGTQQVGTNVAMDISDFGQISDFVSEQQIHLLIVGPEQPLVDGIWDYFRSHDEHKDLIVIGPSQAAARLEGSKDFAKQFMQRYDIPTAAYRSFGESQHQEALDYLDTQQAPIVLKADGLAAGKGVIISQSIPEAKKSIADMLGGQFGQASKTVVIEEFLEGIEFSVFVLTDGKDYKLLPIAKDYKRIGEGDTGLNTGGMGSISPVPFVGEELMEKVKSRIIEPTIRGLQADRLDYHGFVFFGLIAVEGEPYVIEYNCRMGDPETESVIPRIQNDLLDVLAKLYSTDFKHTEIKHDPRTAACVMMVSGGYPQAYEKGKLISGLEHGGESLLFHAGTKSEHGQVMTNGGRVIAITSITDDMKSALDASYAVAKMIDFDGKYYRRDIGFDL